MGKYQYVKEEVVEAWAKTPTEKIFFCMNSKKPWMKFKGNYISVTAAREPADIQWQNLAYSDGAK